MAATRAVLETYELLENIIVHSPPGKILSFRRVSHSWFKLIKTSKRIHHARCVMPTHYATFLDQAYPTLGETSSWDVIPIYKKGEHMWLNRCLKEVATEMVLTGQNTKTTRLNLSHSAVHQNVIIRGGLGEYATSPPCQAICVCFSDCVHMYKMRSGCTVYRKSGVRIADLLDITETMMLQEEKLFNRSRRHICALGFVGMR